MSAFPFYNSVNSQVYSLVHCTSNPEGFKLYKSSAWKVFGGQSSTKHNQSDQDQLTFDLNPCSNGLLTVSTDESCFTVSDIAKYLSREFSGCKDVPLNELWHLLSIHPVFPSDGFKDQIKDELKSMYGVTLRMALNPQTGKREQVLSFK